MEERSDSIITLSGSDGEISVEVIEETVIKGVTYLLVAIVDREDEAKEDEECLILKDKSDDESSDAEYEIVEGEEAESAFEVFEKIIGDDIRLTK